MKENTKDRLRALAVLVGVIIGAGIFGVPYAVSKAGWVLGLFYFILLGAIILLIHLMYGEVILRTNERHRLPGFVRKFVGPKSANLVKVASTLGLWGALVAYLIIGSKFLFFLLNPVLGGSEFLYKIIFFMVGIFIIADRKRILSKVEVVLTFLLILVLLLIIGASFSHIDLSIIPRKVDDFFLPYGIIIFSLFGASAIPEMRDILSNQLSKMKTLIIWGTFITITITILFVLASLGTSGVNVTQDSISGFVPVLGSWVLYIGSLIGFLATFTSFLVIGDYSKNQFKLDFNKSENLSLLLAVGVPFFIFVAANPSFIKVLGLTGAFFGAIDSVFLIIVWQKAKIKGERNPEYEIKITKWLSYLVMILFLVGMSYEVISLVF